MDTGEGGVVVVGFYLKACGSPLSYIGAGPAVAGGGFGVNVARFHLPQAGGSVSAGLRVNAGRGDGLFKGHTPVNVAGDGLHNARENPQAARCAQHQFQLAALSNHSGGDGGAGAGAGGLINRREITAHGGGINKTQFWSDDFRTEQGAHGLGYRHRHAAAVGGDEVGGVLGLGWLVCADGDAVLQVAVLQTAILLVAFLHKQRCHLWHLNALGLLLRPFIAGYQGKVSLGVIFVH